MDHVTYSELAIRHGRQQALDVLQLIERLAQIRDEIISIDMDARFTKALEALSDINFAA